MNITFHECRYILHLKDYDSGVFFYREVLGLQPNYNWSIVPDQKGYRFYMGSGRLEITQIPFTPRQGHSEFLAQCSDLPLCMERILEEMPHIEILSQDARQVTLRDTEGNLVHLLQDDSPCSGGDVDKTDMFTGTFTGVLYEDDLAAAQSFYCDRLGLPLLERQTDALLLQAGDAQLLLRRRPAGCTLGPSMIGLEASSKEYRIVYYSWEFDTLQSFYRDLLRLPQMYGWYTSPVDRGCKFKIGDNRLELICRHPTLPQGPAGMRLEAKDIELCYANLKKEPRVTVIRPLQSHPWGEYSFCIKDPVGNWVEVYQRSEQYRPMGADDGGCYFTDEYTAILFAEDLEKITAFYRDSMQMPVVTSWDRGPEDRGCRLRSAGGFTDIRQKTENTPQGPALTTIEAEDVNACFAWLESRDDVEVLLGLTDTWYGDRIFQICDEEKNVVEVLAYRRNMKNRDTLPQEDPS